MKTKIIQKLGIRKVSSAVLGGLLLFSASAQADDKMYDVTITNLTRGQSITPILVITHKKGHPVYQAGMAASAELTAIAEGGNTAPLQDKLMAMGMAYDAASSGGLLGAGESVTVRVKADGDFKYVSLAAMFLPTNDGFVALNGMRLPKRHAVKMLPVMDAGTENNDELCASIPGPHCGGEPFSDADGEGFVHVHGGIHGVGDLSAADYDWRNPAVKVSISRAK